MQVNTCSHINEVKNLNLDIGDTDVSVCAKCVALGDMWVSLRMCLTCGNVGCCDSSKNKHATEHFNITNHPIMKSVTAGEEFTWCYVDNIYI